MGGILKRDKPLKMGGISLSPKFSESEGVLTRGQILTTPGEGVMAIYRGYSETKKYFLKRCRKFELTKRGPYLKKSNIGGGVKKQLETLL